MGEAMGGGAEALVGRSVLGLNKKGRANADKETPALLRSGRPRGREEAAQVPPPPTLPGLCQRNWHLAPRLTSSLIGRDRQEGRGKERSSPQTRESPAEGGFPGDLL